MIQRESEREKEREREREKKKERDRDKQILREWRGDRVKRRSD